MIGSAPVCRLLVSPCCRASVTLAASRPRPPPPIPGADVETALLAALGTPTATTDCFMYLRERASPAASARIADPDDRADGVYRALTGTAERTQRKVRSVLERQQTAYTPFWVSNTIKVTGNRAQVDRPAGHRDDVVIGIRGCGPAGL